MNARYDFDSLGVIEHEVGDLSRLGLMTDGDYRHPILRPVNFGESSCFHESVCDDLLVVLSCYSPPIGNALDNGLNGYALRAALVAGLDWDVLSRALALGLSANDANLLVMAVDHDSMNAALNSFIDSRRH